MSDDDELEYVCHGPTLFAAIWDQVATWTDENRRRAFADALAEQRISVTGGPGHGIDHDGNPLDLLFVDVVDDYGSHRIATFDAARFRWRPK
jgi:hypothetical protein